MAKLTMNVLERTKIMNTVPLLVIKRKNHDWNAVPQIVSCPLYPPARYRLLEEKEKKVVG